MLGMLLTGTANTILMKTQNLTVTYGNKFNHPFVQCAVMFVGELMCLGMYGIKLTIQSFRAKSQSAKFIPQSPGTLAANVVHLKTDINPLLLAIPACFDIIASTLMNIALTMVAASVYQMLRGIIIIITAVMSIIFLKRKLYRHHWTSMAVIFIGVFMVGTAALLYDSGDDSTSAFGLILLFIAQLFAGGMFIVEEKLLGDYYLDPLKVVGLEGLWGLIIYSILLPIFQYIPCGIAELCPYGVVEDTKLAFMEYGANPTLILLSFGVCCSIACFNAFGVSVTKNASAAQRSTIDTSRTVLIWVFFLAVPIYGVTTEHFYVLQLFGFIFLVIGTLVYNEIIIVPVLGFNTYTKTAI
jgi:drug/metabolite transporter (DMT)-like permease